MGSDLDSAVMYQQVEAVRGYLQGEMERQLSQIKPDVNLAADAFEVLWHGNTAFQACGSAAMLSSPVSYSPSPFQAYINANQYNNTVAGLHILRPAACNNSSLGALSHDERALVDYIDDVRQAIPVYEMVANDISDKIAVVDDVLRDARHIAASGLLNRAGLSVDGYIVATVCIPETIPTDYHRVLKDEGLEKLNICTPANVATAKSELRFLCDSKESCDSLVHGLPQLSAAVQTR